MSASNAAAAAPGLPGSLSLPHTAAAAGAASFTVAGVGGCGGGLGIWKAAEKAAHASRAAALLAVNL